MIFKKLLIIFLFFGLVSVFGQDLGHGDALNRAKNTHAGNLVRLTFFNYGTVGTKSGSSTTDYTGEWPIGSGKTQLGSAEPFIISEVEVGKDSSGNPVYLHPVIFSEGWDPAMFSHDANGKFHGFEPLSGFLNITQKENDPEHAVAMSHQSFTWPAYWPDRTSDAIDPGWKGHWNGYFGKDQKNADQESYFAMDDYEYAKVFGNYSLPLPDSTNPKRAGLGLRMFGRGLQWSNPDAQDVIFWLFTINNIGNLNLQRTLFGFNVGSSNGSMIGCSDAGISNTAGAAYYRDEALAVNFSTTNIGCGGYTPVPWVGYSFLESPGNSFDGIDNDADGNDPSTPGGGTGHIISTKDFTKVYNVGDNVVLIDYNTPDYKRTVMQMPADSLVVSYRGQKIVMKPTSGSGGTQYILKEVDHNGFDDNLNGIIDESDGYTNVQDGSSVYLYIRSAGNPQDYLAKDYLTGEGLDNLMIDERRDDGLDNNGNWDQTFDDVGLDGKPGSGDYGEGNGTATSAYQKEDVITVPSGEKKNIFGLFDSGLTGEPNIDKTDVQESDQIGLTSFKFYLYSALTYSNDDQMYEFVQPGLFNAKSSGLGDNDYVFSCGYFPLLSSQTEFFSVCLVFGIDESEMLMNKQTVQKIYNANYNFAVAPTIPTLKVVEGDHKVILYWDDLAESSFDRYLHTYNFEGYKIYRGTYQSFADAGVITDGYGYNRYIKPLAIYDKVDGVDGFFPNDFGTGVLFNLGNESGLTHEFVDSNLTNGVKYYYAVTAYTTGDAVNSIGPAENSIFVNTDQSGNVTLGQNVIAATPNSAAAGYKDAGFDLTPTQTGNIQTTGVVGVNIINPDTLVDGDEYQLQFLDQSMDNHFDGKTTIDDPSRLTPTITTGFTLTNLTEDITYDTVWVYNYAKVSDTSDVILLKNLYNDSDKDPNTFSANINGMQVFVYNPSILPGILNNPDEGIIEGMKGTGNLVDPASEGISFSTFAITNFQRGVTFPRNYKVVFYDSVVTESQRLRIKRSDVNSYSTLNATNANFRVFDLDSGEELPFGYSDQAKTPKIAGKGYYSVKDYILLYETLPGDSTLLTWWVNYTGETDSVFYKKYGRRIGEGDTLYLYTDMPFTSKFKYTFKVRGQKIDNNTAKESLENIKVVPNPYVVTSLYDPQNPYSTGRGLRNIQFIHLPQNCTINIYSVDGSLVRTIEHNASMRDGSEKWNLQNKDNMEVAYGVYIYHVDAPGVGDHIGKIMLIK